MIDYNGSRDLETFVKFLDNGGVLPEEEDDEDEDEDQESKDEVSHVLYSRRVSWVKSINE